MLGHVGPPVREVHFDGIAHIVAMRGGLGHELGEVVVLGFLVALVERDPGHASNGSG